jgi:hypothetical protein
LITSSKAAGIVASLSSVILAVKTKHYLRFDIKRVVTQNKLPMYVISSTTPLAVRYVACLSAPSTIIIGFVVEQLRYFMFVAQPPLHWRCLKVVKRHGF